MELIGKSGDGWVLTASNEEVYHLCGYYGSHDGANKVALAVGATVNVNAMYRRLRELGQMKGELARAKKILLDAAAQMDEVNPVIEAAQR